jgi:hypothetical protein
MFEYNMSSMLDTSQFLNYTVVQGGSNMTGTNCDLFTHNQSRSYLNHLVLHAFGMLYIPHPLLHQINKSLLLRRTQNSLLHQIHIMWTITHPFIIYIMSAQKITTINLHHTHANETFKLQVYVNE